jgi:dihydrolipoamide dehydrogenase
MVERLECDVAVIGAGTAGLAAERTARRAGAQTLLIDPSFSGTTCATVGCMPSKLLIAAAHSARSVTTAKDFGLETTIRIDGAAVMTRVQRERDRFAEATRKEIAKLPGGVAVKATARFSSVTTLILDDGRTVTAQAIVIATGSRPAVPGIFDPVTELVLTNETIFELADLPKSLAVIGAGPLGLELAQAMARLGVRVALFDQGDTIGGARNEIVADRLKHVMSREMEVHLGVDIAAEAKDGKALLRWTGKSSGEAAFDNILVAAGRPATLDGLDLEQAGVRRDKHGVPDFDRETMRCGGSAIYIAGDATADRPVLHEASSEGAIAGANAARHPDANTARRCVPLSIMFTDPPLATVGRTDGEHLVTGEADYRDQGRARMEDRAEGIARLHVAAADGRLVGAELFRPDADHLGHLIAWSIEAKQTTAMLLDRPFYHPTTEEGLKSALRSICSPVGLKPPAARDEGSPAGG